MSLIKKIKKEEKLIELPNTYDIKEFGISGKKYKLPKTFTFDMGTSEDKVVYEIIEYLCKTFLEEVK